MSHSNKTKTTVTEKYLLAATFSPSASVLKSKKATSEATKQPTPHFSLGNKAGTPLTLACARCAVPKASLMYASAIEARPLANDSTLDSSS